MFVLVSGGIAGGQLGKAGSAIQGTYWDLSSAEADAEELIEACDAKRLEAHERTCKKMCRYRDGPEICPCSGHNCKKLHIAHFRHYTCRRLPRLRWHAAPQAALRCKPSPKARLVKAWAVEPWNSAEPHLAIWRVRVDRVG